MPNLKDTKEFHYSTSKELMAIKDRVRNLIDHWGEEGRYKEAILMSSIKRFLPEQFNIASGFVVVQSYDERGKHKSSNQIDLIIYDTSYPTIFKEGDFVIITPDAVRGIIEVKANLRNQGLTKILKKANKNGKFIIENRLDTSRKFFNGVIGYDGYETLSLTGVKRCIKGGDKDFKTKTHYVRFKVNHISFNKDWFYKFSEELFDPQRNKGNSIYQINDLSFGYFISNLLGYVNDLSVGIENNYFWYPIDKNTSKRSEF